MQAAGYIVILPMIMNTSSYHVISMVQQLPLNPLRHSVYTYIVCRYRITVCLSETTSVVLVHGGFKVSNGAITRSQEGQDICVHGSSMHLLLEMSGEGSLVPSQCMSRANPPPPPPPPHTHAHAHTPAAYIHCSSAAVWFGVILQVIIRSTVAHN